MKIGGSRLAWLGGASMVWLVCACSPPPAAVTPEAHVSAASATAVAAPSAAAAVAVPLPALPSGALAPVEHEQVIVGQVSSAEQTGEIQTLLVTVPGGVLPVEHPSDAVVALRDEGQLVSVVGAVNTGGAVEVWLRRRVSGTASDKRASVGLENPAHPSASALFDVYTNASGIDGAQAQPGHHYQVSFALPQGLRPNPKLVDGYLAAVGAAAPLGSPLHRLLSPPPSNEREPAGSDAGNEWMQLMRLTSGYESIEAALWTYQNLRQAVAPQAATVALKTLTPPRLQRHPWAEMLKAVPTAAKAEPLASLLPSDFYFVRGRSFDALQSLLNHVDELVTPILGVTTQRRELLELGERYRMELGLPEGELTRILGPELIQSLAVAGSDPLLRQGSDLSLLMAVPNTTALLTALAVRRAGLGERFPLSEGNWTHEGVAVKTFMSPGGHVRQHVATHTAKDGQAYVLVSNSPNAVRRIVNVWVGKSSALGSELDFQYMLRRDAAVNDDVLAYMSDKFVAEVVSPRQRILEVRRQVAKAELCNVGYSALLYAQVFGVLPADMTKLSKSQWLSAARVKHTSGDSIGYSPLQGPQSTWGSAARLTPIIDLATPVRVSKTEQMAYQAFVDNYEQRWGENIDPIALRITTTSTALDAHVRVLPVVSSNDYSEVARFSGGGSTNRTTSLRGLAAILALGEQSELRSLLSRQSDSFLGNHLKLDWLGDWVELGLADDPLLAQTAFTYGNFPHPPDGKADASDSDFTVLAKLPLYLAIDIKSAAGAALVLTRLRELATEAAPDVVRWNQLENGGEHKIVKVSFDDVAIYYSLSKNRLVLSPDLATLRRLLSIVSAGEPETLVGAAAAQKGGQLVVEVNPRGEPSALRTVVAWLAELGVRANGVYNPMADLLLRAAPAIEKDGAAYRELALSHLGGIPVTPEGRLYSRAESGLLDPARGTSHAPRWPLVPVEGGAVEHILRVLRRLRTEVSIDPEPGTPEQTSLRTRLLLER